MSLAACAAVGGAEFGGDTEAVLGDRGVDGAFFLGIEGDEDDAFDLNGGVSQQKIDVPMFAGRAEDVAADACTEGAGCAAGVDVLARGKREASQASDAEGSRA